MAEASILPRPFVVWGDSLRPISHCIADRMDDAPPQTTQGVNIFEFSARHFEMLEDNVEKLEDEITDVLGPATAAEISDADVWQVAARIEVHIERILDGFDEVRGVRPDLADAAAFSLWGEIYRDFLEQVQSWLMDILDAVDDPLATLRNRGLATTGNVDPTIRFAVSTPPQVERLERYLEQRSKEDIASAEEAAVEECGKIIATTMLVLVLAGFGLGWLLGGDGDE